MNILCREVGFLCVFINVCRLDKLISTVEVVVDFHYVYLCKSYEPVPTGTILYFPCVDYMNASGVFSNNMMERLIIILVCCSMI